MKAIYKNMPLFAGETASATATLKQSVSNPNSLFSESGYVPDLACLDNGGFGLRSDTIRFYKNESVGYITNTASNASGVFSTAPRLTINMNKTVTGHGLTLYFWRNYCEEIKIAYYNGSSLIREMTYTCNNLVQYFPADIDSYNKITIEFTKTAEPHQLVTLYALEFGKTIEITDFFQWSVHDKAYVQGNDLAVGSLTLTAGVEEDITFEEDDEILLFDDEQQIGRFWLSKATRIAQNQYSFEADDCISILDSVEFPGLYNADGYNNHDKDFFEIVDQISDLTNINITIDDNYIVSNSDGYDRWTIGSGNGIFAPCGLLAKQSCRATLVQLSFIMGALIVKKPDGSLFITRRPTKASSTFSDDRIIGSATFEKTSPASEVKLTQVGYDSNTNLKLIYEGNADLIKVTFSNPVKPYLLYKEDGSGYYNGDEITYQLTPYYAIITGTGLKVYADELKEITYELSKTNANAKKENVVQYNQYKTVSPLYASADHQGSNIVSFRLNELSDYQFSIVGKVKAKVILQNEKLGDIVQINTKYDGTKTGVIVDMTTTGANDFISDIEIEVIG